MIRAYSLYLAWIIALIATFASIYIGEIQGVEPCALCWYQRICMYPLIFILPIAIYRQDLMIKVYILPQLIIGLFLSFIQYLEQKISYVQIPALCGWQNDCSEISYTLFGGSLALWSLVSFSLLIVFVLLSNNQSNTQENKSRRRI